MLALTGLTLDQIDVIDVIEYDDARVSPNGGAIALGHPLGASGIGVGPGIAMIIERMS